MTRVAPKSPSPSPSAAVQVYVRLRPLIKEEQGHELINYKTSQTAIQLSLPSSDPPKINPHFSSAPPLRHRQDTVKTYGGFTGILQDDCHNQQAYQLTVRPLTTNIIQNQSACVFTYGHTGSGKSHTLLGYDDELGVYKFAAGDLFEQLDDNKCLLVRVTELYKDNVVDLITGEACSIRQNSKDKVVVRGPMVTDKDGKINQRPLGQLCHNKQQVVDCVEAACASRRVGTSTHHGQSSRSHLVLELEVVTSELVDQRNLLTTQKAQLTRLKWLQTERMFGKHKETPLPIWTQEYTSSANKLRKEIQVCEGLVKETTTELKKMSKDLGATLVFCDLAGNEYARDASGSTKEELEEAAQINKSLLAVKSMIRALASPQPTKHVPYRDSKLTMLLKRHLQTRAVMLAHLSPSQESFQKTVNTLQYSSMVCASSSGGKKGKENKPKSKPKYYK